MTEQQNLNQILFNNSENKKENKLVLYENIPEKPIENPNHHIVKIHLNFDDYKPFDMIYNEGR